MAHAYSSRDARTVENGVSKILNVLKDFNITFDEGMTSDTTEKGKYGPYKQSERKDIYWAYAKKLIEEDLAYPSFATKEELDTIRETQEKSKQRIGYYGRWAKDRFIPMLYILSVCSGRLLLASKHLHVVGIDFCYKASLSILVVIVSVTNASFDI